MVIVLLVVIYITGSGVGNSGGKRQSGSSFVGGNLHNWAGIGNSGGKRQSGGSFVGGNLHN